MHGIGLFDRPVCAQDGVKGRGTQLSLMGYAPWEWLALIEHELLLFAGFFFLLGALDEFAVDLIWIWLKLTGRAKVPRLPAKEVAAPLQGRAAVFIPAWQEARVIGTTVAHALAAWPQPGWRLYIGCYRNDPATMEAVIAASRDDPRLRIVIVDRDGPSTKADCLNRLYRAMEDDEAGAGTAFRMVVLHDAEDMVDPAALSVLDSAICGTDRSACADFVQLPVLPMPQPGSPWISGHYCEEFAEAHGKGLVVRDAIAAGIPAAGVGCAIARPILAQLAERQPTHLPFAADCLTEDYELGLNVTALGARGKFLRLRHEDGRLVATRAFFPARIDQSVRQKTRWVHGIALQGWDRLGWSDLEGRTGLAEIWMRLRDRRGPLTALVLAIAYLLLALTGLGWGAAQMGYGQALPLTPAMELLLVANFAGFGWRILWRFGFTLREYGPGQAIMAVFRIPVANIIAIMAGRRAVMAYLQTLRGKAIRWDKTAHDAHPAWIVSRKPAPPRSNAL